MLDATTAGGKTLNCPVSQTQCFGREHPLSGVGDRESYLFSFHSKVWWVDGWSEGTVSAS